jgi:hypothetical protein
VPENNDVKSAEVVEQSNYRGWAAYFFMFNLVIFTSLGAGLIYLPAGLITFGLMSGLFGYLLGAD